MTKITEYFYIFSKLTTSLVLFLIIIVMGYAFFKSYQGIDDNNVNLENKISSLSSDVMLNYNNFEKIVKKINDTDKSIDEIKKILLQKDTDTKNANYKEDIENLIKLNEELQKQVDKLTLNLKNIDNEVNTDSRSIESRQIPTLIKLIFIKYENGGSVRNEILLLEDLLKPNKEEIFEKISLLELKKFYGFKNLEKIFDDLAREFVKTKFAKNNQNYVINFLLKFVSIQPSNLTIYENEDLNILMRAKKNLEIRNIQQSLDQILLIKENDMFFTEWVEQVKIYLEFKSLIEKVS
ncbi:MAG: hypothetical protein MK015_02225 [Alphaproteobacteria bacterium]|jgi:hypothetical protein|nr:hypothetical protein [Alphaproteobacteria bacterium]PPR56172.1 MAG: hypothetical protein CFH13_00799 [Alphaproteobacteria bacterium MarineAlpha5_Bin3]